MPGFGVFKLPWIANAGFLAYLNEPYESTRHFLNVTACAKFCRETKHLFLDLPKLSPALQEYITKTSQLGGWTSNCVQVGCFQPVRLDSSSHFRIISENGAG